MDSKQPTDYAKVTHLVAALAPAQGYHFRAVRCSDYQALLRVAPRLRPPFRCARCAGWPSVE